jgi:hypothetical protein
MHALPPFGFRQEADRRACDQAEQTAPQPSPCRASARACRLEHAPPFTRLERHVAGYGAHHNASAQTDQRSASGLASLTQAHIDRADFAERDTPPDRIALRSEDQSVICSSFDADDLLAHGNCRGDKSNPCAILEASGRLRDDARAGSYEDSDSNEDR